MKNMSLSGVRHTRIREVGHVAADLVGGGLLALAELLHVVGHD